MSNEVIVEFDCPQCGAPAGLEETSRRFVCDYCSVKSYLVPQEVYHFVLPGRSPADKAIIYLPFQADGSEFIHPEFKVRVTSQTLEHYRQ